MHLIGDRQEQRWFTQLQSARLKLRKQLRRLIKQPLWCRKEEVKARLRVHPQAPLPKPEKVVTPINGIYPAITTLCGSGNSWIGFKKPKDIAINYYTASFNPTLSFLKTDEHFSKCINPTFPVIVQFCLCDMWTQSRAAKYAQCSLGSYYQLTVWLVRLNSSEFGRVEDRILSTSEVLMFFSNLS